MSQAGPGRASDVCYRHPSRQSFVLCQRCARTICVECQTQAPVGVICPECMQRQRAAAPKRPNVLRRMSRGGRPVVTLSIVAVTAFVYLLQLIPGLGSIVTNALAFNGVFLGGAGAAVLAPTEPWRLLTAALVHSTGGVFGFLHIGFNMYLLWIFGSMLEPMLGRLRFGLLYAFGALGGSVAVLLLAPTTWVVGASGAVFALFGAVIAINRGLGGNPIGLVIMVGINLAIGFLPGTNISWQAHVGGLVTGLAVGAIVAATRGPRQGGRQRLLLGALGVALGVLACARLILG